MILTWFIIFLGLLGGPATFANPITIRDSPITLSVAKRFNVTGVSHILKTDQSRAISIEKRATASNSGSASFGRDRSITTAAFGVPSTNYAVDYVVNVGPVQSKMNIRH